MRQVHDNAEWVELRDQQCPEGQATEKGLLVDVRDRESLPSGDDARHEGELACSWIAVAIASRPGAQYGMARMVSAIAENRGTPVECFTDPNQALEWLRGEIGQQLGVGVEWRRPCGRQLVLGAGAQMRLDLNDPVRAVNRKKNRLLCTQSRAF